MNRIRTYVCFVWVRHVKTKKILRFYFSVDSLERAFDNLIIHRACATNTDTLATAEELCSVIGEKMCLERLWAYLDGVMKTFSEEERGKLLTYSKNRLPSGSFDKNVVVKFTRRARAIPMYADCLTVLDKYYCFAKV